MVRSSFKIKGFPSKQEIDIEATRHCNDSSFQEQYRVWYEAIEWISEFYNNTQMELSNPAPSIGENPTNPTKSNNAEKDLQGGKNTYKDDDESPESSVGEKDWEVLEEIIADKLMEVNGHSGGTYILMIEIMAWLQSITAAIRNDTIISDSDTVEKKLFSLLVRAKNQIDDACDCHEFVEEINRALLEYNQINGGIWYEVHSK